MKHALFCATFVYGLTLANPFSAKALTVCSAAWTSPDATPGGTKSAIISGSNSSCPTSPITATVTVGTGFNAGYVNPSGATWATDLGSDAVPLTSDSSIAIGSPVNTSTNLSLLFSQSVTNPYFYVSYLNAGESITFLNPFTLLDSNGVTTSGQQVIGNVGITNSSDDRNCGFVAQLQGTYLNVAFAYGNSNNFAGSFRFTTGVTPVPAPLPILGAGVALSQGRRFRRLSKMLRKP